MLGKVNCHSTSRQSEIQDKIIRIKLNLFLLETYGVKGLINPQNIVGIYPSTPGHIVDTSEISQLTDYAAEFQQTVA